MQERWFDKVCPECGRSFDLTLEADAEEWGYGHDCEAGYPVALEGELS